MDHSSGWYLTLSYKSDIMKTNENSVTIVSLKIMETETLIAT